MALDKCKGTVGPYDHNVTKDTAKPGCDSPDIEGGPSCPERNADLNCKPFQLADSRDNCLVEKFVDEALTIGAADLNIYRLLGVHEQCKTVDSTGKGTPLSSGFVPGFPVSNAYDKYITEWRSIQKGDGVKASAFLGYDFGPIKTSDESRDLYGIETSIRKNISAISIKQASDSKNRVTRARVERSEDGRKWYGAAIISLPDDDCLNTVMFRDTVPNRYWRLRPLEFNGTGEDYWGVQALELYHNYVATHVSNIQDKIFLENRDRDYDNDPILIKGSYELADIQSELTQFGIEIESDVKLVTVSFASCVARLGRPLIIGDIVEIPSEAQYSAEMRKVLKWMEVTNVTWASEGYTPGWQPTLQKITLQPAFATQETQDIFGDLSEHEMDIEESLGLVEHYNGQNPNFQDYEDASQNVFARAKDDTPESRIESSGTVRRWEDEELAKAAESGIETNLRKIGQTPTALFTEDAMPPNNAPYTEGPEYPETPKHGDYHRLIYEDLSKDVPARLYRYSDAKGRWVFLEKDKRALHDPAKPLLEEYLTAPGRSSLTEVLRKKQDQCDEDES